MSNQIQIPAIKIERVTLRIVGDSPLICHKWSEKALKQIRDKQQKKANKGRDAKDPQADYEGSLYKHPDGGYGFPSVAFKNAAVTACTSVADVTKVAARQAFHVEGELVKLKGKPKMREDVCRVGMGSADLRYRGEFDPWEATLTVTINPVAISVEQVASLFNLAGFAVGVGEWRPEKDGNYGRFHVA